MVSVRYASSDTFYWHFIVLTDDCGANEHEVNELERKGRKVAGSTLEQRVMENSS